MSDSNPHSPLTIEELLRLKRAERPPQEFWVRFERELRQKQLAALLERRPWWQTIPQLLKQRKAFIPVGAAAIIAFALVSVRIYAPVQLAQGGVSDFSARVDTPVLLPSSVSGSSALSSPTAAIVPIVVADSKQYQNTTDPSVVPLSDHLPEHAVELTPWSAPLPVQSLSAKLIARNAESVTRDNSGLASPIIGNPIPIATSRLQLSGGAVAELASVSALASKRTRLLAQFSDRQFTPEPQAPASIRERLTRHLSDSSFTERYTRLGLKGDQVSLRF